MNSDDDPRAIDWAEKKVRAIEERHRELVKQFSDEIEVLSDRINELQNAIASKVRDELSAGFRDLEPEPEFSPPIGRVFGERRGDPSDYVVDRNPTRHGGIFALSDPKRGVVHQQIKGAEALREEAFGRGYSLGVSAAMDEAESRVTAYMEDHFSTGTINGVLDAIRRVDRKLLGEKGPVQNSGS